MTLGSEIPEETCGSAIINRNLYQPPSQPTKEPKANNICSNWMLKQLCEANFFSFIVFLPLFPYNQIEMMCYISFSRSERQFHIHPNLRLTPIPGHRMTKPQQIVGRP